jgi:hypothetical protein
MSIPEMAEEQLPNVGEEASSIQDRKNPNEYKFIRLT